MKPHYYPKTDGLYIELASAPGRRREKLSRE